MWQPGTGDEGYTGLIGGERQAKDAPRIDALGELDEATSAIGLARALATRAASKPVLLRVQRELYVLMAEVAAPDPDTLTRRLGPAEVAGVEADIATLEQDVSVSGFVIPGDTPGEAALDLARAVVRRAERRVVGLVHQGHLQNVQLIRYLNRLSLLLYYLARADERAAGQEASTPARLPT